jgi:molybdate transport system ATP-binding protein
MISVDAAVKLGTFTLDVTFENDYGIVALFGRSGAGKTATINLIAGLQRPDRGRIVLDGQVLVDTMNNTFVPRHRRRVGLVFQDSQLFPHLSVRYNLLFGHWFAPRTDRVVSFDAVVETLGIAALLDRRPARLSGGEKQRVAIGRALLASPRILLLDEPLASLDEERKQEILPLIERLRDEFAIPMVLVSHAIEDVARLANRVVILKDGRVVVSGSTEDVFGPKLFPAGESRFARSSFITGRIAGFDLAYGLMEIAHPAGSIWLTGKAGTLGNDARVVIRATDVTLATTRPENISVRTILSGTIRQINTESDPLAAIVIDLRGQGELVAMATRKAVDQLGLVPGKDIFALIKTVALDERTVAIGHS